MFCLLRVSIVVQRWTKWWRKVWKFVKKKKLTITWCKSAYQKEVNNFLQFLALFSISFFHSFSPFFSFTFFFLFPLYYCIILFCHFPFSNFFSYFLLHLLCLFVSFSLFPTLPHISSFLLSSPTPLILSQLFCFHFISHFKCFFGVFFFLFFTLSFLFLFFVFTSIFLFLFSPPPFQTLDFSLSSSLLVLNISLTPSMRLVFWFFGLLRVFVFLFFLFSFVFWCPLSTQITVTPLSRVVCWHHVYPTWNQYII